jgi:tRNA(Arg) A34 adenosine deaminase TadA
VPNEIEPHLLAAIELAGRSRAKGNHPFGALLVDADGKVVLEGENTVLTAQDCTGHAETNLMRMASKSFDPEFCRAARCTRVPNRARCARGRSTGATYAASCSP